MRPITLSSSAARRADHQAIYRHHTHALILMENAAAACASRLMSAADCFKPRVVVFAGRGNNGADGMALARHLYAADCPVSLVCVGSPAKFSAQAKIQLAMLRRLGIRPLTYQRHAGSLRLQKVIKRCQWIVDALFGIGLKRPVEGICLDAIGMINLSGKKVLSVDVPSGLDADTGRPMPEAVRAHLTVTFGLTKKGFVRPIGRKHTGRLFVDPIGLTPSFWAPFGGR